MKTKSLFSLTIAMLALAACSENEITEQNPEVNKPIGFDTYASVQTRGAEMTLDKIKQGENFGVMAYQTTGDYSTTGTKSEFMKNISVGWDISSYTWEYLPVKFWPVGVNEKVSFFAYAPRTYDGLTLISADASSNPKINFTLSDYSKSMADLVVSDPEDVNNNTMNMTSASGTVKFKFQHQLTRVDMVAKTDVDLSQNDETRVFITGVSLIHTSKLNKKGTLDMKTLTWADNTTDYLASTYVLTDYSNQSGVLNMTTANFAGYTTSSIDISIPAQNETTIPLFYKNASYTPENQFLFLLPVSNNTGTANAGDVKVKIAYDIVNKINDTTHTKSSVEKEVNLPAGILKKGVAYKFIFTIGLNAISFEASVDSWDTTSGNKDINVQ